ncbi:thiol reductase thioredoxin [Mycobacterium vulneris]|uniref:Thioredoxin family protein n=1 Tax=Mycolicibacterium porcinum TaxID=39693 RepID=A0AAP7VJ08_9MYCO|nr:thioredoxin family protein [Mycolicibacterium porcinum]OCB59660.1 thiol reductase thioredoxin [Mycolicibacterium vulneris]MCV7387287.1 thioredoxin family protein [Mycolicibacterium porcinum]OCB13750.1 thiol reductase thioredoxin [Mycolicibacterium porcinum]OCB64344.1 thiol reductase thioredoxin [Mycolicibacterium vulneris]ODR22725.1 thiol reductase thioredoxin [Mycolicibacterium porcinum]
MSSSMVLVIVVLIAALGVAFVIGRLITLRSGMIRAGEAAADVDTSDLGLSHTGPTVLHFSAEWCGPCAGVRRVVDQVCAQLPEVAHVEIDMDANPEAARRLSVLSLPTTIIFDRDGRPRYRTSGVPKAADLRSALEPLLA